MKYNKNAGILLFLQLFTTGRHEGNIEKLKRFHQRFLR